MTTSKKRRFMCCDFFAKTGAFFLALVISAAAPDVLGAVPSLISYQGRLTTPGGQPVTDGVYSIAFRIYDDSTGGNLFWEETKSVTTANGLFSVQLGETVPLDKNTLTIPNLFIVLQVGVDPEQTPRSRLTTVPFAALVGTLEGSDGGMVNGDISVIGQVSGQSSNGPGGVFQSYKTTAGDWYGLTGKYSASGFYNGVGVYGYSRPHDGYGLGGRFEGGITGVEGEVDPSTASGWTYTGVMGTSVTTSPELNVLTRGVTGIANGGLDNTGVFGLASGNANSNGISYYGTYGLAQGNGAGATNYGVYAKAEFGSSNFGIVASGSTYAGAFLGNVNVTGTLSKAGGSFRIDHPLDPGGKYLQHSFVESPDMMNIYNGNVTLDRDGRATIALPDWFESLNRDFRYQLTALGAPSPNLYVDRKVADNKFTIAGGTPGTEVSWQITGVRKDAWAEKNRIKIEVEKEPQVRGTYLHPELYGYPESKGEGYMMTPTTSGPRNH